MENAVRELYLVPECSIEPFKYWLKLFGLLMTWLRVMGDC